MKRDEPLIDVHCPVCGELIRVPESIANAERPPFCSELCEFGYDHPNPSPEPDYGGVLGADGQVYSDADPGL